VRLFVADLVAAGRGATTIRRIHAVLSSALADAVEQRRILHNPAARVTLPKIDKAERVPWDAEQVVAFLEHVADDRLGPLFEVLVGCGLRRGEALALRWSDVDIDARALFVRRTLSDVGGRLVFSEPKTRASTSGVGLPGRVVAALEVQELRQSIERAEWGEAYEDQGLIFARENGAPIRPEHVLKRFGPLCIAAGVPKIRVHDLRHTAATLMIGSGVPLVIVSKVLRHTQVSITSDLYGHLTPEIATSAATRSVPRWMPPPRSARLSRPRTRAGKDRVRMRSSCAHPILKTTLRALQNRRTRRWEIVRPKGFEPLTF
jgi:integrase